MTSISMKLYIYCYIAILFFTFSPFESVLAQQSTFNQKCRRNIYKLFDFSHRGVINVGENCETAQGCKGCAEETVKLNPPLINFNDQTVQILYRIKRPHVHGNCNRKVYWNDRPDPKGPIDERIDFKFRLRNNKIFINDITVIRGDKKDNRPSWGDDKVRGLINLIDGLSLNCWN